MAKKTFVRKGGNKDLSVLQGFWVSSEGSRRLAAKRARTFLTRDVERVHQTERLLLDMLLVPTYNLTPHHPTVASVRLFDPMFPQF